MTATARRGTEPVELVIDKLSHEGRGVARANGKTVFVHGALPGERVRARILRRRGRFDEAEASEILEPSADRIAPRCPHFGVCGGCSLQHVGEEFQLRHKEQVLLELLRHHGGVQAPAVAPAIRGPQWGYRRKARLGVKLVAKKGGVVIGFRERAKPYVADCRQCDVLDPRVSACLPALRAVIQALSIPDRIPQIEVAIGDDAVALVLRHLAPLNDDDRAALRRFGAGTGFDIYLQSAGYDSVVHLDGLRKQLEYVVDGLRLRFAPTDFTQVNPHINERMVAQALDYLDLQAGDRVLDLFCGIGNFTLPITRRAAAVTGIEGEAGLVERARANAKLNACANAEFDCANLDDATAVARLPVRAAAKMLLDPPRAGAPTVLEGLNLRTIQRLVYVSCNPVTFARDAAVLAERHGLRLRETGILDMFPHTAHVEAIALFARA